jgi:NADH-quinone oxidoreductase subunit C
VNAAELADRIRARVPDVLTARGEVTAIVERDGLLDVLGWLRDDPDLSFGFLASVTATHWPDADPAFWVDYELRSMAHRHRARVKVGLRAGDEHLPSAVGLHPTANWHERETFDFYGIVFDGHPDLTRILLPDDWDGYPLRKDEPLGGVATWFRGATMPPIDERGMA